MQDFKLFLEDVVIETRDHYQSTKVNRRVGLVMYVSSDPKYELNGSYGPY